MCNEHWCRPAFIIFLVEMSAESEWLKEISVVSIEFGIGEKVESKCKVEYDWRPDVCTHCNVPLSLEIVSTRAACTTIHQSFTVRTSKQHREKPERSTCKYCDE